MAIRVTTRDRLFAHAKSMSIPPVGETARHYAGRLPNQNLGIGLETIRAFLLMFASLVKVPM